jgi:hypothetical protein
MPFVGGHEWTLCDLLKKPAYNTDARCGHLVGAVVRYQLLYLCGCARMFTLFLFVRWFLSQ